MPCRLGVGEGAVGKPQRLVDSPEPPQCEGVTNFRDGVGIRAEPVDEIAVACLIVEFDGLLTMVMGAGKAPPFRASARVRSAYSARPKDRNRRRTVPRRLPPSLPIRGRAQRRPSF